MGNVIRRRVLNSVGEVSYHEHIDVPRNSGVFSSQGLPLLEAEAVQDGFLAQNPDGRQAAGGVHQSQFSYRRSGVDALRRSLLVLQR